MRLLKSIVIAGMTALSAPAAHAADAEFMTWTYTEETGKPAIQKMLDDFKASSGLEVEAQGYAWGDMTKNYLLRARSNTLPDVGQITERWLPTLAELGQMADLNEIYGKETLEKMFPADFLAMGQVGGRQLALPWIGGTVGMVANKEVLAKAGVAEIPATVEEFRAALVKVRDAIPNSVPYALATKNGNSIVLDYLIWTWTFGGDVVDGEKKVVVDTPAGREAMAFLVDLLKERLSAPEIDRPDARRLFAQGQAAFYIDAPQARTFARQFSGQGEAYDVNVLPIRTPVLASGSTPASIQWGHVISLFNKPSLSKDAPSAKFVMHLLSDGELIDYAANQSVLPTTVSALENGQIKGDPYLSAWAAATVSPRPNTVGTLSNGAEVATIIGEEVQAAVLGQKSSDQAVADLQSRLEASMAKANN